jgi:hypothetical protein
VTKTFSLEIQRKCEDVKTSAEKCEVVETGWVELVEHDTENFVWEVGDGRVAGLYFPRLRPRQASSRHGVQTKATVTVTVTFGEIFRSDGEWNLSMHARGIDPDFTRVTSAVDVARMVHLKPGPERHRERFTVALTTIRYPLHHLQNVFDL